MLWLCPDIALDGRDSLQPEVLLPAGPRPGEKTESHVLLVTWLSEAGSLTSTLSVGYLCTPISAALGQMVRNHGGSSPTLGGHAFSKMACFASSQKGCTGLGGYLSGTQCPAQILVRSP